MKSVLLVDDNPAQYRLLTELVKEAKSNITAYYAEDGQAGFEKYIELRDTVGRPDIILLDLRLGMGVGGYDVARMILHEEPDANIYFYTFFPHDLENVKTEIPILSKQLEIEDLIISLKKILGTERE